MKKPERPPSPNIDNDAENEAILSIMKKPAIQKYLFDMEHDYPYWEEFKHKAKKIEGYDPKILWKYIRTQRNANPSILRFDQSSDFQFKYNTTHKIVKYLHEFDMNIGGNLAGGSIIPAEDRNQFLISSIMEEAIASSQLEGAVTTREVAKEMLRTERKPRNESEKMILNNYITIKRILELKNSKLTKELILEIHSLISKGTLEDSKNEGKFRTNNDVKVVDATGEVFYSPPDHKHIDDLMHRFCQFANSDNDQGFVHPIIRAIVLHFLIGYIHPFVDGNGRTARAIFYWFLISKNYWLIEYMSVSRIIINAPSKYAKAYLYTEYDGNDLTYFIDYNLMSMDSALKSLKEYIQRKIKERRMLFFALKNEKINSRQIAILSELINNTLKAITIKEIQNKFGVVYQTARTDLMGLANLGYLQMKDSGHNLIFFRSESFDSKIHTLQSKV